MTPEHLRWATQSELAELSDLCMRSKAHWGYDAAFMEACRDVLRVKPEDLDDPTAVIRKSGVFVGTVRVCLTKESPDLSRLFVCPEHMGQGIGSTLLNWAKATARAEGCPWLHIESDPDAASFYEAHGAEKIGEVPSEAIANRFLPLYKLSTAETAGLA